MGQDRWQKRVGQDPKAPSLDLIGGRPHRGPGQGGTRRRSWARARACPISPHGPDPVHGIQRTKEKQIHNLRNQSNAWFLASLPSPKCATHPNSISLEAPSIETFFGYVAEGILCNLRCFAISPSAHQRCCTYYSVRPIGKGRGARASRATAAALGMGPPAEGHGGGKRVRGINRSEPTDVRQSLKILDKTRKYMTEKTDANTHNNCHNTIHSVCMNIYIYIYMTFWILDV